MRPMRVLLVAACATYTLALRVSPQPAAPARPLMSRRQLGASALAALPLLFSAQAAHAGLVKKVEDIPAERLAELAKNRGPELGEDQAYRIVCDRDDEKCLAEKRAKAQAGVQSVFGGGPVTKEERSAIIQKQAKACRAFCGREDMRMQCAGDDLECLAKKKELREAAGAGGGEAFAPYVVAAAVVVGGAIVQAPEKSDAPKGMQIRQEFYEKRKRDTAEYEADLAGAPPPAAEEGSAEE